MRKIVHQLTASVSNDIHTKLSPAAAAGEVLRDAREQGLVLADPNIDALAMQIYLSFNGALLRWAVDAFTDAAFKAAARQGLLIELAARAAPRARGGYLDELRSVGPAVVA